MIRRAMALPPTGEGVEELVQECIHWDPVYKQRVYSAIAWSTGLTFHEIGKLADDVRHENRRQSE